MGIIITCINILTRRFIKIIGWLVGGSDPRCGFFTIEGARCYNLRFLLSLNNLYSFRSLM